MRPPLAVPVGGILLSLVGSAQTPRGLQRLDRHVSAMERSGHAYQQTQHRPFLTDHPLGDRLTIFPVGQRVVVWDHLFQQAYLADLPGTDTIPLEGFVPDDSLTRATMSGALKDLTLYDSLASLYPSRPQFEHEILAMNSLGAGSQVCDVIHYVGILNGRPTILPEFIYFDWKDGHFSRAMHGNWIDIDPYMIVLNFGYQLTDTMLTTSVLRTGTNEEPPYLIADWDRVGDSLAFRSFRGLRCPDDLYREMKAGGRRSVPGLMREGWYGTATYPLLYHLTNDREYDLRQAIFPTTMNWSEHGSPVYTARDMLSLGNEQVMLLYQLEQTTELAWIDLGEGRMMRKVRIDTQGMDVNTIRLMDDGRLIACSKENDAFIVIQ